MKITFFILIFSLHLTGFSQSVFFETSWGGTGNDFARSVRQLSNGDIYVFGFSNSGGNGEFDYALNKLDRYGNLKWTKYYGGSLTDNGLYMNTTADGNFIMTGESYSSLTDIDVQIYKVDTSGTLLWSKRYGSTATNESSKFILATSDGGYVLCGFKSDAGGSNDSYILKLDSSGDTLWTRMFGGTDNEYAQMVKEIPGDKYVAISDTRSFGAGNYDVSLLCLRASDGGTIWSNTYGDTLANGSQGLGYSASGDLFCWGETEISQFSPFDFYLEKTDTAGNSIWKKVFGGVNSDAIFSLTELADSSLIMSGYSNSYNTGPINLVVLKADKAGNFKWIQNYGGPGIEIGFEIIPSAYNGFLVCGQTNQGNDEFYLLHLDSAGLITGISNEYHPMDDLSFYPNPASGAIRLSAGPTGPVSYRMLTSIGVEVDTGIIHDKMLSIRPDLTDGIYFLELRNEASTVVRKLVLVH